MIYDDGHAVVLQLAPRPITLAECRGVLQKIPCCLHVIVWSAPFHDDSSSLPRTTPFDAQHLQ